MKISKVLFTSKAYKNGEYPVMIRIYHKKLKHLSTGVTCKEANWNTSSSQVSSRDREYREKNEKINNLFLKLQTRLQDLQDNGMDPTIENLLSDKSVEKTDNNNLIWLYKAKSEACKAPRTQKEYLTFKKVIEGLYGSYIDVNAIDQRWVDDMRRKIDEYYGEHNSQKNHFIKCFFGVYTFAAEKEFVKIPRLLKCKNFLHIKGEVDLTNEQVSIIINAYKKDIVAMGRKLDNKEKEALSVFILMIAFQGLSNIDLASLKIKDIEFSTVKKIDVDVERYNNNGEYHQWVERNQEIREVVVVNTRRRKTEIPVKIITDKQSIIPILEMFYDGKGEDEYLIPCFSQKTEGSEKKEIERCARYFNSLAKKLRLYLDTYCEIWEYSKIPHITYYMARHAFINRASNLDIPHNLLRKMIGHKEGVMEKHYITPPTKWEQADVTYQIFNQSEKIKDLLKQRFD